MSTATAGDWTVPTIGGHRHFLLRRLHSLTGIIFGGYIVVHLIVNATLIEGTVEGKDVFAGQVGRIHGLPFLWAIEWIFIFLPILYHTAYGIWITLACQPNTTSYPYARNIFYVVQRASALVITGFLIFHVLGMKGFFGSALAFNPADATTSTIRHINAHWSIAYIVYPIGIVASCYHLANGFWTAAITWGLTISAAAQRRWGAVCIGLFLVALTCGTLALSAAIAHRSILVH